MVVQEYWFHDTLPFDLLNAVWHIAPWLEGCFLSQESIKSFSRIELFLWDSYVTLHKGRVGLLRNKSASEIGRHTSQQDKRT